MNDPLSIRRLYGRRHGHPLRAAQADLVETLLPRLAVPAAGPLDAATLFGDDRPLAIEIGFGRGEHLGWQAANDPATGFIGCEPFLDGMVGACMQVRDRGLGNVRLHPGDAIDVLERLPDASLSRAWLLHPDPWPKARHAKRRFMNAGPIGLVAAKLAPGGRFRFGTDDPVYVRWAMMAMAAMSQFDWQAMGPRDFLVRPGDWPETRYEAKARAAGREVWYFEYRRTELAGMSRFESVLDLARRHGPGAPIWRKRAAILSGAVVLGLVALLFADAADWASHVFLLLVRALWWAPLVATPAGFALLVWLTRRYAPAARGSGIPQIMAARLDPDGAMTSLASARTACAKFAMTIAALLVGASVGREGPTVQISATIMGYAHRLFRVPLRASAMVAGGAAGVAAAFNTPLAGVTFAIEELAAAYEQKMTLLVMTAVLISGMVSLGLAGDYVYFGAMTDTLPIAPALLIVPVAGVIGGLAGGVFSRAMLAFSRSRWTPIAAARARPVRTAAAMGLLVAAIGCATGMTWGTSYEPARLIIIGADAPWWFGPAKFAATLATAVAGLPGGIFAPSLAVGAGLGELLKGVFASSAAGPVVLLGMTGYFTGVVRAPLTAVVIISEATASRGLLLPLLATALIADAASSLVSRERLYHGLSHAFIPAGHEETPVSAASA